MRTSGKRERPREAAFVDETSPGQEEGRGAVGRAKKDKGTKHVVVVDGKGIP